MATSTRVTDIVIVSEARSLTERWVSPDRVEHPPLLELLREQARSPHLEEGGNAPGRAVVAKMPVAQEVALSLAIEVEVEIARIVRWMGGQAPLRQARTNLLWIINNLEDLEDQQIRLVAKHLRTLQRRAEGLLNLSDPRRALQGRCPECEMYGTVLVTFNRIEVKEAWCSNCMTTWSQLELGILSARMREMDK